MDFRRKTLIRIDRVLSRVHSHLPAFTKDIFAAQLETAYLRRMSKLHFMQFIDGLQCGLYEHFAREYRNESFAQLLALKLCNLAVAKYHFINRHSVLMSGPLQLIVDPANACQLACPGCIHSSNRGYSDLFDWPRSTLPVHLYDRLLESTGISAFCAHLYNYGEPLLHRRFVDFVRASKKYLLFTMTSTNLSMPLDNPAEIVESGLDRMILSIDGTTQPVYAQYRRKGNLDLVFDNVKKLVAAKRKLRSSTPHLVWQFLTFEHNAHQVRDAIRMAETLGLNEILIQTPFSVAIDDPSISPIEVPERGTHTFQSWDGKWCSESQRKSVDAIAAEVQVLFGQPWEQRFHQTSGSDEESQTGATCDWLYQNLTMDGAARIMPCCMAPGKDDKHLVFTHLAGENLVNSPMARLARLAFADRGKYQAAVRDFPDANRPYCAKCKEKPLPYGLANISGDIRALDARSAISRSLRWALIDWA